MKLHPLLAVLLALAPGVAFASSITTATAYQNVPTPSDAGAAANQGSGLASATFTVGALGINFQTGDSTSTPLHVFLNNPTFSNQVNGFDPNAVTDNTEVVITGFISLNAGVNSFVVAHDDGVIVNVAGFGNVVDAPGPTGEDFTPILINNAGAAGNYAFTVEYVECCGGPADLVLNINNALITSNPVPEPGSLVLFGTGMLGFAGAVRRRFVTR